MYSAKTVALAILLGNCIGFSLWTLILIGAAGTGQPGIETEETPSIFGIKSIVKVPYKGQEEQIKTNSLPILDYILELWFILTTGWALWVILNPITS
jgi:hypothetical protein